ncbi:hypothetical protein [Acinetobacter sp. F-1]|uniref:hypothetical protein n=1 Tax=Acinetobacter sp. F-1 TaxID=1796981 RepID=UPI001FD41FD6|nr:hypothetical protein [Acinetobacter sp. F-1]
MLVVKSNELGHRFITLLVFFLASSIYYLTIPALVIIYMYLLVYKKWLKINKRSLTILVLFFSSIGLSLFVGLFDSNFGESLVYSIYLFALFFAVILLVSTDNPNKTISYIYAFLFGSFFFYSIILFNACIYNFSNSTCGYGGVYNLFTGSVLNTPGYANSIVLYPILCLCYMFVYKEKNSINKKIYAIFVVVLCVVLLSFLASRASYVLLLAGLLMVLALRSWKNIIAGIILLFALIVVFNFLLDYMQTMGIISFDLIFNRFEEKGFETQRVERYMSGLEELLTTPIGIYQIDPSVGANNLIHNIYLDLSKFGGWSVFISFVIFSLLGLKRSPFKMNDEYKSIFIIYIICFISLQQDVFYGAGLPVLVIFLMSNTYLFCWSQVKKQTLSV